jgi:plastocyanin
MSKKLAAVAVALGAAALAACAGGYGNNAGTGSASYTLPNMPDLVITAKLPNGQTGTAMEELPGEGLGTVDDPNWKATLGGFTQQSFSQALGFAPGTVLTIKNISKDLDHTFNEVKKIKGPPAKFPANPKLSTTPSGGNFGKGYASGAISPGTSVTVTLAKKGIYLFGCAFHYHEGMQDVIVIADNATPGPQATAPGK